MGDLYDAVTWQNLVGKVGPKAGYRDGTVSRWPAEAWTALHPDAVVNITVIADANWEVFDSETGNAGVEAVAAAMAARAARKQWSVGYTNQSNFPALTAAMRDHRLGWADAKNWPAPAVYLWASVPGQRPGTVPAWCPVTPVAVQDRWEQAFDVSTTFGAWPTGTPHPAPAPAPAPLPQGKDCELNVPVLQQGAHGPAVHALQTLLGGIAADGIFGPATHARLCQYQQSAHLAVDGVAGTHTWGALLGVPQ